ncbi:MAG: DUF305 domain-containing protein [Nocardioidaceae bacterium]
MSRSRGWAALGRARQRVGTAALGLALAVVTGGGLAACSGQDQPAAGGSQSGGAHSAAAREAGSGGGAGEGTILQPGRPGEPAKTLPPGTTLPADRYNRADVNFMQSMVVHHAQALEMGRLARTRAGDPKVQAMAERITDSQGAEILNLSSWLKRHRQYVPTRQDLEVHMQHMRQGMMMMPGMIGPAQMDRLEAARGARFDALFLHSMIRHHEGALEMASGVGSDGRAIVVGELAAEVASGQQAEIDRMRTLLKEG